MTLDDDFSGPEMMEDKNLSETESIYLTKLINNKIKKNSKGQTTFYSLTDNWNENEDSDLNK